MSQVEVEKMMDRAYKYQQLKTENERYQKMQSLLLSLLDRIEIEEDYALATQRFDIAEECGYTVVITGEIVSGSIN